MRSGRAVARALLLDSGSNTDTRSAARSALITRTLGARCRDHTFRCDVPEAAPRRGDRQDPVVGSSLEAASFNISAISSAG